MAAREGATSPCFAHLIEDIERLREHLGITRWVVVGGSWGVTLALAYAQHHPERVTAMALRAVTAGTRRETDWITRDMGRIFLWPPPGDRARVEIMADPHRVRASTAV